ncbi:MAG: hypothetical protein ACJA0N_000678 [Pseudohongiellaceae bacterium]|jgi:hypothetical protein
MPSTSNVVNIENFRSSSPEPTQQELIDDIGAKAFMFMRGQAAAANLPVKEVLTEHMLGLMMVIESVEGSEEARRVLSEITDKLSS